MNFLFKLKVYKRLFGKFRESSFLFKIAKITILKSFISEFKNLTIQCAC